MRRILAAVFIVVAAGGCAVTRPAPKIDPGTLDRDSYLSWLADQPMVSTSEAYRAMLIAATDEDPGADFAKLQREVFARDIARPEWKLNADQAIDKATAAFMGVQVAKLRGGINLNLWGRALHLGDRRYAYREIVYQGLPWESSPPYMVITGGEFVSLLTWADQWRAKEAPALPAPPSRTVTTWPANN